MYTKSRTVILKEYVLHSVCLKDSTYTVKCMFECMHHVRTRKLVVARDVKGETTLHCASESVFTDAVICLLDFIPPEELPKALMVKDLKGRTPFQRALKKDFHSC